MATSNSASSKYDYITCKELINGGSPAVWQLRPKKDKIGNLTRMTLGEKNPHEINKTILLVGETGSGKSTLINALVNFAIGVKWKDDVWFQIVEEKKNEEDGQSGSQTSEVIVYQIFGFEGKTLPFSLTIIDTPGYGDTRELQMDELIGKRLHDLFCSDDGVHEINAVGLVLNASTNRLSDRLSYIFDSVVSLFGKDLERNIVALITHSNGGIPKNALKALDAANIKCARNEKKQPFYFLFDNCQNDPRTEDTEDNLEHAEKTATKGMKQFTAFLEKTAPQNLETTVNVQNEQIILAACIQNLKERVESVKLKQNEIQQTQKGLEKNKQKIKDNEEFTVMVDEQYKEKEDIDHEFLPTEKATCCKVCEENCHFPGCTVANTPYWCEVMKDGRCTVCTKKCKSGDHVRETWRFVTKTRKVETTFQDVKKKYEKNKTETEKKMGIMGILQKEMENLEANKAPLLNESYECFVKLEQIALNVVSVSTYDHLIFLIEELEKKKEDEKVKKLKDMTLKKAEGFQAGLKYRNMFKRE